MGIRRKEKPHLNISSSLSLFYLLITARSSSHVISTRHSSLFLDSSIHLSISRFKHLFPRLSLHHLLFSFFFFVLLSSKSTLMMLPITSISNPQTLHPNTPKAPKIPPPVRLILETQKQNFSMKTLR